MKTSILGILLTIGTTFTYAVKSGPCVFDGTLNSFKKFEGYYVPHKQKKTIDSPIYLRVDLEQSRVVLTDALPHWFHVGDYFGSTKLKLKTHSLTAYYDPSDASVPTQYENRLVIDNNVITAGFGTVLTKHSLKFECSAGGELYMRLPKYEFFEEQGIVYVIPNKKWSGIYGERMLLIPSLEKKAGLEHEVKVIETIVQKKEENYLNPQTNLDKLCGEVKYFGYKLPSVCQDRADSKKRLAELSGTAKIQLDFFRSGIINPVEIYGPVNLSDRTYLQNDSRAIYSYDPLYLAKRYLSENQLSDENCLKKNSKETCEMIKYFEFLDSVEFQAEELDRFI